MEIKKLFELLNDSEKEKMFALSVRWKSENTNTKQINEFNTIDSFIAKNTSISTRLKNILKSTYYNANENKHIRIFKTIEEINIHNFFSVRHAGVKAWKEFVELRGIN